MNKKGFTVVELIVSITLTFVIVSLLFQVLLSLRDVYVSSGVRTQLLNKQTLISTKINEDLYNRSLATVLKCGRNCLNFIYQDGSNARMIVDTSNNIFRYGEYSTELVAGSRFNNVDIRVEKTNDMPELNKDSVLIIKIPIMHNLFDVNYGVNVLFPFNSRETAIEDVVFDGYNDEEAALLLKGSSNMKVYHYTEPGWYTVEGDNELIENDPRVEVVGSVDNDTLGIYELDYVFRIDGNIVDVKTRAVEILPPLSPFVCGEFLVDERDGNTYETVQIGDQCWFAENLAYTTSACLAATWTSSAPFDACRENGGAGWDQAEVLYQWGAVMNGSTTEGAQGLCPTDWHIPSDAQWTTLANYVGSDAGTKLKDDTNWEGTNTVGFNATPAGFRFTSGFLLDVGSVGVWWSSSPSGAFAWVRYLFSSDATVDRGTVSQDFGYSVRCLLGQ